MGQYGLHSCRSGDAGAVATTTSASAPKQAIVISTLTGRKIRLIERVDNVVGPLTQNRRATGSWSRGGLRAAGSTPELGSHDDAVVHPGHGRVAGRARVGRRSDCPDRLRFSGFGAGGG